MQEGIIYKESVLSGDDVIARLWRILSKVVKRLKESDLVRDSAKNFHKVICSYVFNNVIRTGPVGKWA